MLTLQEKQHIKDVIQYGLNINRNINFPYFLNAIKNTNDKVDSLESLLNKVIYNQQILEQKIDLLIKKIK